VKGIDVVMRAKIGLAPSLVNGEPGGYSCVIACGKGTRQAVPDADLFAPDASRGHACDRAMHGGLADSLRYILGESAGKVPFDRGAIERLILAIEDGQRFPPSTFALYYDLVPALLSGDHDAAAALFDALAHEQPIAAPLAVYGLDDPALASRRERYLRVMNGDEPYKFDFLAPAPAQAQAFRSQFDRACALLERAAPELLGEMRAIISELILVVGRSGGLEVDGGSSYRLWGALFLNAERHQSRVELVEVLAHESGHSVLFGLSTEEPHVLNPDDERYPSPLRMEGRPMDGVFHATYVSARMHWTMSRLIASDLLTDEERAIARNAREEDRRNFEEGYATIIAHARLTDTGRQAIGAARAYISAAA
jgi:hypothetical protein